MVSLGWQVPIPPDLFRSESRIVRIAAGLGLTAVANER